MKFATIEEFNEYLYTGDLYCVEQEIYLFSYNECDSICYYRICLDDAKNLQKMSEEDGMYWGAHIGYGEYGYGWIYDGDDAQELLMQFMDFDWIPTKEVK